MKNILKEIEAEHFSAGIILAVLLVCSIFFLKDFRVYLQQMRELENQIITETTYLASVDYSSEVSGRFYMGIGYAGEKQYYVAYEILEDGGMKLFKMSADTTIIYDTLKEDELAYLERDINGSGSLVAQRLYVPKGTIMQEYDLSFE